MHRRFALSNLCVSFLLLFVTRPALPQTQASTQTPQRDPQAIAVLTQVLAAAGGVSALGTIQDFTGTGTITYYQPESLTANVTVRGTQAEQYRQDVTLSTGVRSQSMSNGQWSLKREDGTVLPLNLQVPLCPQCVAIPYLLLAPVMNSPQYSVIYKGSVTLDGNSVIQIELQLVVPGLSDLSVRFRAYHTLEFFIDPTSYQILMMQDTIPKLLTRQVRYSNYQNVNGVITPFSVAEELSGLATWSIQFSQISFNSGLTDADFQL